MRTPSLLNRSGDAYDDAEADTSAGRVALSFVRQLVGGAMIMLVLAYQLALRPLLVGQCKFIPTCSEYFIEAVRRHGPIRGGTLGLWRILRCHPFKPGGYDPVP